MHCRIYLNAKLELHALVDVDSDQAKYLKQVMRLQAGDVITVFNGQGGEFKAEITALAKDGGQCMLLEFSDVNRELPCRVHIIQAANRSEKIETVLQKATEMGAASFQVVSSERATLNLPENKRKKRLQRWQKIVSEAAEQSERTVMPNVQWVDKLVALENRGECFVLHPRDALLWQDIRADVLGFEDMTLAVGPEGGWSNQELQLLQSQGFKALMFGQRIMRTETAAPALLAAIQAVV
ncbi:MAG TPA: 16S rRNA (uracil(1498)-N(3))-methyltransferase [Ghiorsea sp.]|nr:16S rRNA (uracil(1498)-N(3))-methyltransferase [Ghiorsea sp.]HIP07720.1 16S rRNA (uracil(1498)-N(3))-methyltransferase [Mariprofundaceae bacterium]